jgi:hypothetical protein
MPPSNNGSRTPTAGARNLQDRLHELLSRLASTSDIVKNWPESESGDSSIHVERTTRLIASIRETIASIQKVEGVVQADAALKQSLEECLIPLDLLDLLDHGGGLNPECFSRGLLQEAMGQLAGLKRRKRALEMLGFAVQRGIEQRDAEQSSAAAEEEVEEAKSSLKRERKGNEGEDTKESPTKKVKVEEGDGIAISKDS